MENSKIKTAKPENEKIQIPTVKKFFKKFSDQF